MRCVPGNNLQSVTLDLQTRAVLFENKSYTHVTVCVLFRAKFFIYLFIYFYESNGVLVCDKVVICCDLTVSESQSCLWLIFF